MDFDLMGFLTVVGGMVGGGGAVKLFEVVFSRKKIDAETSLTNTKNLLEIDTRLNERVTKLEARVAMLEKEKGEDLAKIGELHKLIIEKDRLLMRYEVKYGRLEE